MIISEMSKIVWASMHSEYMRLIKTDSRLKEKEMIKKGGGFGQVK